MKIRKGDKIKVMAGKDRGKISSVLKVFTKTQKILVEGVNIIKKHVKPGKVSKEGGIIKVEKPIHVSNVMYMEGDKPIRLNKKRVTKRIEPKKVGKNK